MLTRILGGRRRNPEAVGFLASLAFACLASVRDVYLGGLFQRVSPLAFALLAFGLCAAVFFPIALVRSPGSLRLLARRPKELLWVNATTALAWISFFYALRVIEPSIVQILFSGVGPLSVLWVERLGRGSTHGLSAVERRCYVGLGGALVLAAGVALAGLSGAGPQPLAAAAFGVGLALGAGLSISISTMLCRRLNDEGVEPMALVSVRFLGALAVGGALGVRGGHEAAGMGSPAALGGIVAAALLLIVFPIYVSQVGIALASPLTVRAVLAVGPVLILGLQLAEGRLSTSPYSLAVALLYGAFAVGAAGARRRAIARAGALPSGAPDPRRVPARIDVGGSGVCGGDLATAVRGEAR